MLNKIIYTILGIGIAFVFFPHAARDTRKPAISGIATQTAQAQPTKAAPEMALNLSSPELTAKSAVAYDLDSGTVLYSKNLDDKLPIASLTKLMTALVTVNRANTEAEVTISKNDLTQVGSTVGLVEGEKIKVSELLKAMLIPSGNDAALALADFVSGTPEKFAEQMNEEARKLNLTNTNFSNPVGWDSFAEKENFSNALDMIKVTEAFLQHENLREIAGTKQATVSSVDGKFSHHLRTTNQLLLDDPNVQGVKTGFTSKALGNLIVLYNYNGTRVLSVILDSQDREQDSLKLLDWVFKVYRW
ncbi:MAG: D-alanyl-D-alanine carboxypeptidase [Candidatus Doudnabacteria bacterium]|nr:D-alanyl-D-alanine carboxypeptidase [Candidatus Doudnabacteria bacterium]